MRLTWQAGLPLPQIPNPVSLRAAHVWLCESHSAFAARYARCSLYALIGILVQAPF